MLKLIMLKENMIKVMESIGKENYDWKDLVVKYSVYDLLLHEKERKQFEGKRNTIEVNITCPDYIKESLVISKEQILKNYTPINITLKELKNIKNYWFIIYDSKNEIWEIECSPYYIEGVDYYTEEVAERIAEAFDKFLIRP